MVIPCITLIGSLYFCFQYFILKYNLIAIYPKKYQTKGKLSKQIVFYAYLSLYLQQATMIGVMSITLEIKGLVLIGYSVIFLQILIQLIFYTCCKKINCLKFGLMFNRPFYDEDKEREFDKELGL